MPELSDRAQIRAILETARNWAVCALGDLEPGFFENSRWFGTTEKHPSIALLYSGFAVPLLIFVGACLQFRAIVDEMTPLLNRFKEIYVVLQPEALDILKEFRRVEQKREMSRMILDTAFCEARPISRAVPLKAGNLEALRLLFRDGEGNGEAPEWFHPAMLEQGTYFGIFEQQELIAAGGTHVFSRSESIAGLGNIYTRRDRRGRGLAAEITSAIINHLLAMQIRTIALNVRASNDVAIRVYERLGFRQYCKFYEAIAAKPE